MFIPLRKPLAIATVLAAGGLTALSVVTPANASHPGSGTVLTSADGSQILIAGGSAINPRLCQQGGGCSEVDVPAAQWSPDGSRAVFISGDKAVLSVRFNKGDDIGFVASKYDWSDPAPVPPQIFDRAAPTYADAGSTVVWAERAKSDSPWRLMKTTASGQPIPWQVSPEDGATYTNPDGGNRGLLVYQRNSDGGSPEIWIAIGNDRQKLADGSEPAISPNGKKVAFVGADGHIWTVNADGSGGLDQVTEDGITPFNQPTWSPSGNTIAFNQGITVRTVSSAGGTSVAVPSLLGPPAFRSEQLNKATRLSGPSRFETATSVSQWYWKSAGDATDSRPPGKTVVLSRSDNFADALGGAALAAAKEGPLLLTPPTSLNPQTAKEITRVLGPSTPGPDAPTVYLLGSVGAISADVEKAVQDLGYNTKRLQGADRFTTSLAIANEIDPEPDLILAATGMNFPDALAAGAAAGSYDTPGSTYTAVVVLTDNDKLPAATQSYLDAQVARGGVSTFGIGQSAANAVVPRYGGFWIIGSDRYETAAIVGDVFFGGHQYAGVATGDNWPDALAGGALLGRINGPLLLTPGTASSLHVGTASVLSGSSPSVSTVFAFGGPSVVGNGLLSQAGSLIGGPLGCVIDSSSVGPSITSGVPSTPDGWRKPKSVADLKAALARVKH